MAARAMSSGTISFGLVAIPVKLYSTVDSTRTIRFNYLSQDGSRLKQQYIRASDGEVVDNKDRVQGYEFAKGKYVVFTADEIKAMNVESTNAIEIIEFAPVADVERVYIEKVYYLGPDKGAGRSYHLLKEALLKTKLGALAKYAARGKSHLVLIRPMGDGLVMEQLKHADELRPFSEVPLESCKVAEDELTLALQIIDQRVSEKFEPERYEDEVRSRIMQLIEQKIDGQEISMPPEEQAQTKIVDLLEALKASLEGKSGKSTGRSNGKAGAKKPTKKPPAKAKPKAKAKASAANPTKKATASTKRAGKGKN